MKIKLKDGITNNWHTKCMFYKCRRNAYRKYAGIVCCKKCYENWLIKDYGNLKRAKKYIKQ